MAWLFGAMGCTGTLTGNSSDDDASERVPSNGLPQETSIDDTCESCSPSAEPHLVRLTHAQWGHAVRDLFELSDVPDVASSFSLDSIDGRFSTSTAGLQVHQNLWLDYERAAESVAREVRTAEVLERLAPERDKGAFLSNLGRRCYRRPLTESEFERYEALFDLGATIIRSGDDFADGVEMFARTCLQSPHFLYRTELTEAGSLTPFETVSKLSLGLWGTGPDDALLDTAEAGGLDAGEALAELVDAMLLDERAHDVVRRFHIELFHIDKYRTIVKDEERFPLFQPRTPEFLEREAHLFLDEIVFAQDGNYSDLLTSRTAFVNTNLAALYGLPGNYGEGFEPVELDSLERSGILTRLGFLAKNANALEQDPIHRGVSVALDITCTDIPPPPDNIEIPDVIPGETVRERVTALTSPPACAGCHESVINPPGFAFGNYDADGTFITTDAGQPIDPSGAFSLDGEMVPFQNAVEFSDRLAASAQVHRCYSEHLLEYFYGRGATPSEGEPLNELAQLSVTGDTSVLGLIRSLILSDLFLSRTEAP